MVQIQSSWFPMFDRNPQTFVDIYHARPADYVKAMHRVYRSARYSSHVVLPILHSSQVRGADDRPVVAAAAGHSTATVFMRQMVW
jgi:hypothetical protein